MFAPSEVSDVTTGRPVVYVPAGWTVADDASRVALMENRWNNPPQPVLASRVGSPISSVSRVAPAVASRSVTGPHNQYGLARNSIFAIPKAISGLGDLPTSTKVVVGLGLVGLVAGLYFATQGK
jgi:hypothetical protein